MKYLAFLVLALFLTACAIQSTPTTETQETKESPRPQQKIETKTEPVKEEIFVKETTRRYGIELKYSGLRDEDNLLCANFYAQDITPEKSVSILDKDPNLWFAYIYSSPDEILRIDSYKIIKNEEESSWSNKYCLLKSEIPSGIYGKEERIIYTTSQPDEVYDESFLNIRDKDNRKTFTFKDVIK